ncbi:MAG: hypothetical protein WC832_09900 [Anaerolineales bacterium]
MNKWEYTWLFLHRESSLLQGEKAWFLHYPDGTKVEGGQQINAKIQKLGDEGWELVAVVPISNLVSGRYSEGWTNELQYIFKRLK